MKEERDIRVETRVSTTSSTRQGKEVARIRNVQPIKKVLTKSMTRRAESYGDIRVHKKQTQKGEQREYHSSVLLRGSRNGANAYGSSPFLFSASTDSHPNAYYQYATYSVRELLISSTRRGDTTCR